MTTTGTEKATKPAAARRRQPSRATRGAAAAQPKPTQESTSKSTPKSTDRPEPKGPTTTAKRTAVMNAMIVASADLIDPAKWAATVKRFPKLAELNVSREEATEFLSARLSYAPADAWDARLNPPKELKGRKVKSA